MLFIFILAVLIVAGFVISIANDDATIKGIEGERQVAKKLKRYFAQETAFIFNDIILRIGNDATQIDHIVICTKGIFVVETKNYKGWIFGNPKHRNWTQVIYGHKTQFQNPIRQNYKHLKFVQDTLGVTYGSLISVVVFTGDCEFKTYLSKHVIKSSDLTTFFNGFHNKKISEDHVLLYAKKLNNLINKK